jgi:hypothetical protein
MAEQHPFLVDVNLNQNELIKAVIANHATNALAGTGIKGQIYYNTTNNVVMVWTDQWVAIGSIVNVDGTAPIQVDTTTTPGIATISIDDANAATTGESGIDDGTSGAITGKDQEKLNSMEWDAAADQNSKEVPHTSLLIAVSDEGEATEVETALHNIGTSIKTHRDKITATSEHNELKKSERVTKGDAIDPNSSDDDIWASEKQIAEYVNGLIGSSGRPAEPYLTGGANVSYPPDYAGGAIKKGDHFIIADDAGSVGPATAKDVNSNDSVIANKDAATNIHADWTVIISAPVLDASYTVKGITKYSIGDGLVSPVDTHLIDDIVNQPDPISHPGNNATALTPLALQYYAKQFPLLTDMMLEVSGTLKTGTITHNWDNKNVMVDVYDKATGKRLTGGISVTANSVTVVFNQTPAAALSIATWIIQVMAEDRSS